MLGQRPLPRQAKLQSGIFHPRSLSQPGAQKPSDDDCESQEEFDAAGASAVAGVSGGVRVSLVMRVLLFAGLLGCWVACAPGTSEPDSAFDVQMDARHHPALPTLAVTAPWYDQAAGPGELAGATHRRRGSLAAKLPTCLPVRHYSFTLGADRALACVPHAVPIEIIRATIPDTGLAVARLRLMLRGMGPRPVGVHGWGGDGDVGDAGGARRISWGAGEGVCPSEAVAETVLAYGELTAADHEVGFSLRQYRSSGCVDGTIGVGAASTLDVWVEDPTPHCRGRDIVAASYFQGVWDTYGAGSDRPLSLTTDPTVMIAAMLNLEASSHVTILAQTEISPAATSNACGARNETGFLVLYGPDGGTEVVRDTFAPSGGMSHVLIPLTVFRVLPAGSHRFRVAAGVDQVIRIGALAGATFSGDTLLFLIAQR